MGSLSSSPKVPTQTVPTTRVIYVNAPATTPTTTGGGGTITTPTPDQTAAEARTGSLLSRDRSRFGTIATSFRGLLDLVGNAGKRKTLLGE
jgi:hypothetical protein